MTIAICLSIVSVSVLFLTLFIIKSDRFVWRYLKHLQTNIDNLEKKLNELTKQGE